MLAHVGYQWCCIYSVVFTLDVGCTRHREYYQGTGSEARGALVLKRVALVRSEHRDILSNG
jgi:hypothetical protein